MKTYGPFCVIEIIDDKRILIDYGIEDGAEEGEKVIVYTEGEEIIHPISKEPLGTYDTIKDTLEIVQTYNRFSLCMKIKRITVDINALAGINRKITTTEHIKINENEATHRKKPSKEAISVGDLVKVKSVL